MAVSNISYSKPDIDTGVKCWPQHEKIVAFPCKVLQSFADGTGNSTNVCSNFQASGPDQNMRFYSYAIGFAILAWRLC